MDETTPNMLAKYMVAKYKLGHIRLAAYLAAVLFEYTVKSKLKQQDEDLYKSIIGGKNPNKLENIIKRLRNIAEIHHPHTATILFRDIASDGNLKPILHNFRRLRNDIVHEKIQHNRDIEKLITYVWAELHPESFEKSISDINGTITIDTSITDKEAAYWVREIDHYTVIKESSDDSFRGISKNDFEDLFVLKQRMLSLKRQLDNWLNNNRSFGLKTTPLTNIDTASAYIWMPMAQRKHRRPSGRRPSIYHSSVCITATPLDIRIHLEFGGRAISDRRNYYRFLQSDEYREFIYKLPEFDELKIFDVIWYTFIERERMALDVIHERDDFIESIEKAKKKLDDEEERENIPVTWNKLLNGYIIRRNDIGDEVIDIDEITPKLRTVIELYSCFSNYAQSIEEE